MKWTLANLIGSESIFFASSIGMVVNINVKSKLLSDIKFSYDTYVLCDVNRAFWKVSLTGLVANIFNSTTGETESGGSQWIWDHPGLPNKFQDSQSFIVRSRWFLFFFFSQKEKQKKRKKKSVFLCWILNVQARDWKSTGCFMLT